MVTATTATEPVLKGAWLSAGTHINAIGTNYEHRRELDSAAVAKASVIATNDLQQVEYEATDLAAPVREQVLAWDQVCGLGDIVAGNRPGEPETATLPSSNRWALGVGQQLPDLAG